ncbi:hypothetical protein K3722_13895 [Leisingera caerulea]|uniref:Uncharacterized protein n=1 Tax=Leisingera caerulea TaxID=506591 RepID=A0ABY5WTF6_LEICA|nr:hypothetical protein [Leisingera caerulea]UWQ57598.1 hypothetical protein K3722_13895 [Leisingera caerulea]
MHIFLGIKRAQAGTDLAIASCGQVNQKAAVAYRDNALSIAQRMKDQQELAIITDPVEQSSFEFI